MTDSRRRNSHTTSTLFDDVLAARLSRRDVLVHSLRGTAAVAGALSLPGCGNSVALGAPAPGTGGLPGGLRFEPVPKSIDDVVHVPAGYRARVLYALGDPIHSGGADYGNQGAETDFDRRSGDHHDGMYFFGLSAADGWDAGVSERGLLCVNHENITDAYLHPAGPTADAEGTRPADEVDREMQSHGVGVIEIQRTAEGSYEVNRASSFNRRITTQTAMDFDGPAAGDALLVTRASLMGTQAVGTLNNCANGYTPWGTYLTCEENWNGYFRRGADEARRSAAENTALARYGIPPDAAGDNYRGWDTVGGDAYARFDCTAGDLLPALDFRNEPNHFGWIVEIDPFDPASTPRKHTALGRFAHEGCWPAPVRAGAPVVFYMGDDSRFECIYKFVSDQPFDPALRGLDAGERYLGSGTLYAARFDADGTGSWLPLVHGDGELTADNPAYPFASQADVLIHARLAADAVGATRMDRPEWAAVSPVNGEVYVSLTNNSRRKPEDVDAANPRSYDDSFHNADGTTKVNSGNVNGHIVRWREDGNDPAATTFRWDIYLFGAEAGATASVNLSELTADNDFSSPDGMWFDPAGVLWIETDDGAYRDRTNCMLLASLPGQVGDGRAVTVDNSGTQVATPVGRPATPDNLRRFLVGPMECELTGLAMTPDRRALFVNIQHPGEDGAADAPSSHWPAASGDATEPGDSTRRPRSATLVITREDGGEIAL